ncbi:MAG TPA: cytochrome c oxidase assembly protein, partial [Propionibacteriaceae bacterium]|nr:cytochrome c oxidase assembly protein [Propionibacteriaceae bacterium]
LGDLVAHLAGAASLGVLAAIVMLSPSGKALPPEHPLWGWMLRTAQLWFAASLLMTFANPSFVEGMSILDAFRADAWWLFLTSTVSDLAWLVSVLVAVWVMVLGWRRRVGAALPLAWLAGAAAAVFVAVTGGVSVGLNHDWATDAVGLATLASLTLTSGAVVALAAGSVSTTAARAAAARYQRWVPLLVGIAAVGYAVGAWQQLAGESVFSTVYGVPVLGGFAVLALLAVSWVWRLALERRSYTDSTRRVGSLARDVVLLLLGLACLTAVTYLTPPRFLVPQSTQVNYLGYEMNVPATIARLTGLGRPNVLWVVLASVAIGLYAWGVVRVVRGGGRWPVSRLLFWLAGWLLTLYLAVSGLWMYSTAVYSWHMLVHMTVNMMVPVLCVLGAPVSLVRAASHPREGNGLATVVDVLDLLAEGRFVRTVLSPPVIWVNYVGSLFVVYFSALFPWLMRYHWGHQLMLLDFMVAGYLFFGQIVGPDRHAWQLPYILRFALLLSIMPFHAIFAVGIMSSRTLIGAQFYKSIDVTWVHDLLADQNIAGQVTWFTGEVPGFVAVLMLTAQWFRSDTAAALAADRRKGAGGSEDELAAYNDMLAELANRDRGEPSRLSREDWL